MATVSSTGPVQEWHACALPQPPQAAPDTAPHFGPNYKGGHPQGTSPGAFHQAPPEVPGPSSPTNDFGPNYKGGSNGEGLTTRANPWKGADQRERPSELPGPNVVSPSPRSLEPRGSHVPHPGSQPGRGRAPKARVLGSGEGGGVREAERKPNWYRAVIDSMRTCRR